MLKITIKIPGFFVIDFEHISHLLLQFLLLTLNRQMFAEKQQFGSTNITEQKIIIFIAPLLYDSCVKSNRIQSYSGPYFPAFGLNTERCRVSLGILSECELMRTRITPNTDTFYAAIIY